MSGAQPMSQFHHSRPMAGVKGIRVLWCYLTEQRAPTFIVYLE